MSKLDCKTKRYTPGLTDEDQAGIAPVMLKPGRWSHPRDVEFRELINSLLYLVRAGFARRMLPIHFGPWQTGCGWC
jgi:transposase